MRTTSYRGSETMESSDYSAELEGFMPNLESKEANRSTSEKDLIETFTRFVKGNPLKQAQQKGKKHFALLLRRWVKFRADKELIVDPVHTDGTAPSQHFRGQLLKAYMQTAS